ncbi:hypothetical protein D3C85_1442140 [compost metagenome]
MHGKRPLLCQELRQGFHLGTPQSRIQVGHAVVKAGLIVIELEWVRHLGRGGDVLGASTLLCILTQHHAAATSGDDFVAVEAQGRE